MTRRRAQGPRVGHAAREWRKESGVCRAQAHETTGPDRNFALIAVYICGNLSYGYGDMRYMRATCDMGLPETTYCAVCC